MHKESKQSSNCRTGNCTGIAKRRWLICSGNITAVYPQRFCGDAKRYFILTEQSKFCLIFCLNLQKREIKECVSAAYAEEKFSGGNPAPISVVHSDKADMNILELWHGPTCAFKDMALQLLPHLLTHSLKITKCDKTAVILVATSGDTGKAALEGFKDVDRTKMLVFYPENGVKSYAKTSK